MIIKLYHTGDREIKEPDIKYGRKNADFGQGFYLSPDRGFTYRWAKGNSTVNIYELNDEGLNIKRFNRNEEWFEYIFNNRRGNDTIDADVVTGPIANDTIFETYGIISSGFLKNEEALELLSVGPEYTQTVIKTEKALNNLKWIRAERITRLDEDQRRREWEKYTTDFAKVSEEIFKY